MKQNSVKIQRRVLFVYKPTKAKSGWDTDPTTMTVTTATHTSGMFNAAK